VSLSRIIETGSYTGNGSSQTITIGWQSSIVFTMSNRTAGGATQRGLGLKFASMASDTFVKAQATTGFDTDGITITSTGFSVGGDNSVNRNGDTYYWCAIRDGHYVDTGSYTGGGGTTTVTINRQPGYIFHARDGSGATPDEMSVKHPSHATALYWSFEASSQDADGLTITSTGFTATTDADVSGTPYYWGTIYDTSGDTRNFETGTYTGNGTDPQAIALGRQPKVVLIQEEAGGPSAWKTDQMGSTDFGQVSSTYTWETGGGVAITATGFSASNGYNTNGTTYRYLVGYR
jgi:hypothetical protein